MDVRDLHVWRTRIVCAGSALALSVALAACGGGESTSASTAASAQESTVAEQATESVTSATSISATQEASTKTAATSIGDASDDAYTVTMTNGLGSDITSFSMRGTGETSWGNNLLKVNEVIKKGDKVKLGFVPSDEVATYDFVAVLSDGTNVQFEGVALDDASVITLKAEGATGIVEFGEDDSYGSGEGTTAQSDSTTGNAQGTSTTNDVTYDDGTYVAPVSEDVVVEETYAEEAPAVEEPVYEAPVEEVVVYEPVAEAPVEQTADDCTRDNIIIE